MGEFVICIGTEINCFKEREIICPWNLIISYIYKIQYRVVQLLYSFIIMGKLIYC